MSERSTFDPAESRLFALLSSPAGVALQHEICAAAGTPAIALATRLRRRFPSELVAATLTLNDLRLKASAKFARAGELYLTRAGLEQATSERIATWRARRFEASRRVADLCTGIGGDLMALAALPGLDEIIAVDLDPDHLAMAIANARLVAPHVPILPLRMDVREVDLAGVDGVFIDPARRDLSGRMGHGESEPPLDWAIALVERVASVGIKLAPGLPHDRVPNGWELETIALDSELKEAALWSPALATTSRRATVVGAQAIASLVTDDRDDPVPMRRPAAGMWLHDPNPAITRAGLVATLARQIDAAMIDRQIGFLVTDAEVASPFTRVLPILASEPWNERTLKATLAALDAGPVDIRRRGLAGDVERITRRLRGRGSRPIMLAMTRVDDAPWAIVCENVATRR